LRKKPKKGKICQSFETTKIEKHKKQTKTLVQTLPIKDIFQFHFYIMKLLKSNIN